jgi:phosphoglycolate phosphatase
VTDLSRVRGIVFDLDGTLVDGFQGITTAVNAARAAARLAPLSRDAVTTRVGRGLEDLLASTLPEGELARGLVVFRETYDRVCESESAAMPGAAEVLPDLAARGYRLAVASNKLASFSIRILRSLALAPSFDAIHGPDSAGRPKPDPAMIEACLVAMRVPRSDAVYVGDMTLEEAPSLPPSQKALTSAERGMRK